MVLLSCSNENTGSGGTGGQSTGAGGAQIGDAGSGGSVTQSTGGTSGAIGSGGTVTSTGGRAGAAGGAGGNVGAPAGGRTGTAGAAATGGAGVGGAAMGGAGAGGAAMGAAGVGGAAVAGTGGQGGSPATCPLPKTFKWTSTGPLAQPKAGWVSLKNFSDVVFNNLHIVYYSGDKNGSWAGGMMAFPDWDQMATATQYDMPVISAAPTILYFRPKKLWIDIYQYTQFTFSYVTSTDPTKPSSWSAPHELYNGSHGIDNTVICNSTTCYLFWTNDDGKIYRSSMPIDSFPGVFTGSTVVMSDTTANLFEAEQVYAIAGTNQYLMIVEAMGSSGGHRYFRSFTTTDLGGSWTPLAATESNPFAAVKTNVTFANGNAWTADISHGDIVRNNPDETQTIDPCNLQFLYQGTGPSSGSYIQIPYRPGLLTLVR